MEWPAHLPIVGGGGVSSKDLICITQDLFIIGQSYLYIIEFF